MEQAQKTNVSKLETIIEYTQTNNNKFNKLNISIDTLLENVRGSIPSAVNESALDTPSPSGLINKLDYEISTYEELLSDLERKINELGEYI